jgi:uncharacterized protein
MSSRRRPAGGPVHMTPAPSTSASPASSAPGIPADAEDDLHRRAVELREYRMGRGTRPAGLEAPVAVAAAGDAVSVTFPVQGMTCRACEVRIARHVGRLPGVARVSASAVHGRVTVDCTQPVSARAIEQAIGKAGYQVGHSPWVARDPSVWATAAVGVLLVAGVAVLAAVTGLGELAGRAGELAQGGVLVALVLGLAAGVSTCMALVGGLVLGLSASFAASRTAVDGADTPDATGAHGRAGGAIAGLRPAAVFVMGRVAGYAAFGAILGALGAAVAMPPQLTAVLMLVVAVVMFLLGTRLTGLSPRMAGWSPTLPMGLGRRLGLTDGTDAAGARYSDGRTALLGALTFFLPCGFTQAVQVYALSTGSPLLAATLLGAFAIGTAPGLLAVAGLPAIVPARSRPAILRVVGVAVIGFALLNATAGLRLTGLSMPNVAAAVGAAPANGTLGADGVQRITTHQDLDGYSPGNVVIYAGHPTEWTIESSSTATCAASLFVPSLDIRARLEKGSNTFTLPALEAGTVNYTCAMGMYGGRITVVDGPGA